MNCRSLFRPNVLVNWLLIIHFVLQSNGLVHGLLEVVAAEHESASVSSQSHKDHNHHRDGSQRMSGSSEHTAGSGHMHLENRNSYSMLSAAMKQAVNHEFGKLILFFLFWCQTLLGDIKFLYLTVKYMTIFIIIHVKQNDVLS